MSVKRHFVLIDKSNKNLGHTYTGATPRTGAIKAASDGFKEIRLRETNTKKVHVFSGKVEMVAVADPSKLPVWIQKSLKNGKIKKANVSKICTEHLDKKPAAKKVAAKKPAKKKVSAKKKK